MLRLPSLLLALCPVLGAQDSEGPSRSERVLLRINDRYCGPVPYATVEVVRLVNLNTTTEFIRIQPPRFFEPKHLQNGCFLLDKMPAGTFLVIVDDGVHARITSKPFSIKPGVVAEIPMQMNMGGTLHGKIQNERGEPVVGATVRTSKPQKLEPHTAATISPAPSRCVTYVGRV